MTVLNFSYWLVTIFLIFIQCWIRKLSLNLLVSSSLPKIDSDTWWMEMKCSFSGPQQLHRQQLPYAAVVLVYFTCYRDVLRVGGCRRVCNLCVPGPGQAGECCADAWGTPLWIFHQTEAADVGVTGWHQHITRRSGDLAILLLLLLHSPPPVHGKITSKTI